MLRCRFIHRSAGEIATAELRKLKQGKPSTMRCTDKFKNSVPGGASVFCSQQSHIMRDCRCLRRSNNTWGVIVQQPLQGNNNADGEAFWPARKIWCSDGGKRCYRHACKSALSRVRTSIRELRDARETGDEVDMRSDAAAWWCTY